MSCVPSCIHAFFPAAMSSFPASMSCVPSCIHVFFPAAMPFFLPASMSCVPSCIHVCLPSYIHVFLFASVFVCLPASMSVFLPASMSVFLHPCLSSFLYPCLSSFLHLCLSFCIHFCLYFSYLSASMIHWDGWVRSIFSFLPSFLPCSVLSRSCSGWIAVLARHGCCSCNCGPCRKAQGLDPTGSLVRIARASGFSNVHDFLIAQRTGETPKAIWARKRGKQWCWSGEVAELCWASIPCSAQSGGDAEGDGDGDGDGDGVDDGKSRSPAQAQTCRKRLNFFSHSPGNRRKAARSKNTSTKPGIVDGSSPASRKPPAKRSRRKSGPRLPEKPIEWAPLVANAEHRGQSQHVLPVKDGKITPDISPRAIEAKKIKPGISPKEVVREEKITRDMSPKVVVKQEKIKRDISPKVVEEEKIERNISPKAVKEEVIEIPAPAPSGNPTSTVASSSTSVLPRMHHPPSNLTKIDKKDEAHERSNSVSTLRNFSAPMPMTSFTVTFDQGSVDAIQSKKCGSDFVTWSKEDDGRVEDAADDQARGARNCMARALIDVKRENPWPEVPTFCPHGILDIRAKQFDKGRISGQGQEAESGGGDDVDDDDDDAKRKELLVHGKKQQLQQQHVCKRSTTFKERLDAKLSEPFDAKELEILVGIASHRKPMYRARETRNSSVQVISNQEGNSYLDYYPELEECLQSTNCPLSRLSILRGFFFWLENASCVGAFKPWISSMPRSSSDDDCVEIDAPDCEILAVVYSVGDDDDKSNG